MMHREEKLEIAKRLRHLEEMEMSRDDLEQMLEDELAKPEAEMDTELVQLLLEELEEAPSEAEEQASWNRIDHQLRAKRRRRMVSLAARAAAIVVAVAGLAYGMYGTARAFNWTFLLRLMNPFAETFMVYSGNEPEATEPPAPAEVYGDTFSSTTQMDFASLADCPDRIDQYPAKPVWMPERFHYLMGSMYADMHMTSVSHMFKSGDGRCMVDIIVFADDIAASTYQFEQVPDHNVTDNRSGYQIKFYHNTENDILTASWMVENAHYCVSGTIREEEIISILNSMMK